MVEYAGVEHDQTPGTITDSAVDILAATDVQRDVIIQNNHATATIYINLSGDATVEGSKFVIGPGNTIMSFPGIVNAVSAIGDIALNEDVAISEGNWR